MGGEVSLEDGEDGSGLLDSVLENLADDGEEARGQLERKGREG